MNTKSLLPSKAPRHWLSSLIIVLCAQTLAIIGFSASMPIIPFYIQSEFGITDPDKVKIWNGLLNGVPTLMLAIFAPIWGALGDRKGRKFMLLRAMLGGGFSIALMFFAQNIYQLFFLRVVQGATTGSIAAANVLVLSIVPLQHSAISLAVLQIGIFVGMAVGPFFGGWIFDIAGGKANFLLSALLLFTAAMSILFLIKEPPLVKEKNPKKIQLIPDFSILQKNPLLNFLIISMFFSQIAISLVNTQLSLFVAEINTDPARIGTVVGMVIATAALTGSLGALIFGYLSKKLPLEICFFASLAGAALCYLPQAFSRTWEFLLVTHMVDALFLGGVMPIFNVILNILAPEKNKGAIFGLSSSISFIGASLGPFFGSSVAISLGMLGNRAIFILGSGILFVILFIGVRKKEYWAALNTQMKEKMTLSNAPISEDLDPEELLGNP
ncbi:MAG: MFS transporter [Spirochaetia bacterium]